MLAKPVQRRRTLGRKSLQPLDGREFLLFCCFVKIFFCSGCLFSYLIFLCMRSVSHADTFLIFSNCIYAYALRKTVSCTATRRSQTQVRSSQSA